MGAPHYIADDLGIHRDHAGEESFDIVTALTWLEIEDAIIEEGLLLRLLAERAMDEWETR